MLRAFARKVLPIVSYGITDANNIKVTESQTTPRHFKLLLMPWQMALKFFMSIPVCIWSLNTFTVPKNARVTAEVWATIAGFGNKFNQAE
jgi:hypothetical protein